MKSRIIVLMAVLTFLLSACTLSLAEDITPPPNYQSPTPGAIAGETAAAPSATPQAPDVTAIPDVSAIPGGTPAAPGDVAGTQETTSVATGNPVVTGTPAEVIGSISGKVVNGSGGTVPSALKAVLHIYEHDTTTQQVSEVATQEAPVGVDGAYKFDQLPMPANRVFYVSVNYANTDYESDQVFPTAGQTSLDLPLTIYDTTTDNSGLVADQAHFMLDYSKPDIVQVVEFLIITNSGTKSVIAAEQGGAVVKVVLPKGYTNLQFEQGAIGDRYIKTDDGFADTTSVVPGTNKYQLVFAIDLALPQPGLFGGQKLEFTQPFPLKVNGLSVLAPEGVTVEGANFTSGGLQDMGTGAKYQVFNGGSLEAGKSLLVTASGAPKVSAQAAPGVSTNQNIIIGVGAFGLVLIITGVWMYWRERQRVEIIEEDDIDEDDDDGASMEEIMDAIVALDDQFKAGNIQEVAYKERRAELKAKLKDTL